jgi:hypothetical protein
MPLKDTFYDIMPEKMFFIYMVSSTDILLKKRRKKLNSNIMQKGEF